MNLFEFAWKANIEHNQVILSGRRISFSAISRVALRLLCLIMATILLSVVSVQLPGRSASNLH